MVAPTEVSGHPRQEQPQETTEPSITRAVEHLRALGAEFVEHAKYLLSIQIDRVKFTARRATFVVVLGVIGAVVLIGALAVGAGLLLVGLSGLLGMWIGNFWAGATIVGFLMIALPVVGTLIAWKVVAGRTMKALRQKYADARLRHKAMFNRDIKEVARG